MTLARKRSAPAAIRRTVAAIAGITALVVLGLGPAGARADTVGVFFDADGNVGAGPNPFPNPDSHTARDNNTAVGPSMMPALDEGEKNVAVGTDALDGLINGANNTAVGYRALAGPASVGSTAFGSFVLDSNRPPS